LKLSPLFKPAFIWQIPLLLFVVLIPVSITNNILFHTLVESFAVIIAMMAFVVTFNTYSLSKCKTLMYIGNGYFWVAALDFCHLFSFSSLNAIPAVDVGTTIQFWIAARVLEALVLLSCLFVGHLPINRRIVFSVFMLIFSAIYLSVQFQWMPVFYIDGEGLTTSKVIIEYAIMSCLIGTAFLIARHKTVFDLRTKRLLIYSILMTVAAEMAFTLYSSFSSISFIVGHLFKLVSFWLLYVALVEKTLTHPLKTLSLNSSTFDALPDAFVVIDSNCNILHANETAQTFSADEQTIIGQSIHDLFHQSDISADECHICHSIIQGDPIHYHEIQQGPLWYEITLSAIASEDNKHASKARSQKRRDSVFLHVSRDISLRKEAQSQYQTVDRLYKVLRHTNKAMIDSLNQQQLLDAVCQIAVEHGLFSMAWVGLIEGLDIKQVASSGDNQNYLSHVTVRLDESDISKGPVGRCAKTQRITVINNVATNDTFLPWREPAIACGYRSLAAIPISIEKKCIGVFALYSTEVEAFDTQVTELLESLSDDISSAITYIRAEEQRLKIESELKQLSRAVEQSKSAIVLTDVEGKIQYVNPYYTELSGYSFKDVVGKNMRHLPRIETTQSILDSNWDSIVKGEEWHGEVEALRKDGSHFWAMQSVSPIADQRKKITHLAWTSRDNTELHNAHETISQLAYYDPLTELPNRRLYQDRFEQAIHHAKRYNTKVALMYFDLDNFKVVNDSWGHDFGDLLLKHAAQTIQSCIRESDTVARLGGDEFCVILADLERLTDITYIADNMIHQLNQTVEIEQREISITTSIGISIYPDDGATALDLMKCADMAMYYAKENGKNNFKFYESFLNVNAQMRSKMEKKIQHAINNHQFELYYQPQIDSKTGKLSGVEALIRWFEEDGSQIQPSHFIPIAEESSMIIDIGNWVIKQACLDFAAIINQGFPKVKLAINISANQFQQTDILLESIDRALFKSELPQSLLQLEITESALVSDIEDTITILKKLKSKGISFAIDDFGTGYSSLSYLKRFPVDIIKIDRSFVRDIENDLNDRAIIRAISVMAHELGVKVLAEGVENEKQLEFVKSHQCDFVQGFYYDKPMSLSGLLKKYKKQK
jgi:diguanylate cyclase (GGDEF)-like protein/PAS domain S-box-containing protein